MTEGMEDSEMRRGGRWRLAAWGAAVLMLLVPLLSGMPWSGSDYVFAAVLLFGSLGIYELTVRLTGDSAYRGGVGMALAAIFLLLWINGAVGITDSSADGVLLLVPAIAFVGAVVARFRPRGMSLAMFAAAFIDAAIGVGALIAGIVPAYNPAGEILGLTGFFAVLFVGSGLLFRQAGGGRPVPAGNGGSDGMHRLNRIRSTEERKDAR